MPRVQPKLNFISPAFNPVILRLVHWSLPILQRFRILSWLPAGIKEIEIVNGETLVELYHQFQIGKIRLILAFRHCEVDDPLSGLYLLSRGIPRIARQQGITLESPIHSHFMYDRGMTIWAGDWLGWWYFPVLEAFPYIGVEHLICKRSRRLENYWSAVSFLWWLLQKVLLMVIVKIVSPLESGVAQLAFWCVEDLAKANRVEKVMVVPINIQYHYPNPQWSKLDRLLRELEADCGLSQPAKDLSTKATSRIILPSFIKTGRIFNIRDGTVLSLFLSLSFTIISRSY